MTTVSRNVLERIKWACWKKALEADHDAEVKFMPTERLVLYVVEYYDSDYGEWKPYSGHGHYSETSAYDELDATRDKCRVFEHRVPEFRVVEFRRKS